MDASVLPGFIGVILLFLLPPGPDMAYMIAVGLQGGRRAAVRGILGIGSGMAVYAAAVVAGVGEIARSHPLALTIVKLGGACYLAWLAYATIRSRDREASKEVAPPAGHWYTRGLLISLTNPKLLLFFLAVLPQFIGDAGNPTAQLALLGLINVSCEVVLYGCVGVLAGYFHARFQGSQKGGSGADLCLQRGLPRIGSGHCGGRSRGVRDALLRCWSALLRRFARIRSASPGRANSFS